MGAPGYGISANGNWQMWGEGTMWNLNGLGQDRSVVRRLSKTLLVPVLVLAAAEFAVPANAADRFYVTASPTAQQNIRYQKGVASVYDQGAATLVRLIEVAASDGHIALDIAVTNKASVPIKFGPENVQIATSDGKPLAIIPYEQLVAKEEKRQKGQRFWRKVVIAANMGHVPSANTNNVIMTANTNGMVGNAIYSGTTTYTYRDQAAEVTAQREEVAAFEARQAHDLAVYDVVLRTTTVDPGASAHGTVQFEVSKELGRSQAPVVLVMTVTVNGEMHRFIGQLRKTIG